MKLMDLTERLGLVSYRNQAKSDIKPHIEVDTDICNSTCPHKCTTYVCPANCYTMDEDGQVHFQVEDCIECGTCMYACDQGAVDWNYPDPEIGRGVTWNFG
ncbi:ferredoxin family protein [Fodinibius sp. SL11]|uniref:ferredoxin family protein n=1 Tax=Fodinibius sp. SL11 TaxID=3425690 RepID=UPI003F884300